MVTSDGGRTSSKASALRSRASWHRARPIVAPSAAGHREHRAADLDRPLVVEDAEGGARLPVRHALVLGELAGESPNGPCTIGLSASACRRGRRGGAGSGCRAARRAARRRRLVLVRRAGALGRRAPGSRRRARRRRRVAGAAPLADLLGQLVDAGPDGVALGGDVAQPGVELGGGVSWSSSSGLPAPSHRRDHGVEVGAQQADVDHSAATLPATPSGFDAAGPTRRTRARPARRSACLVDVGDAPATAPAARRRRPPAGGGSRARGGSSPRSA